MLRLEQLKASKMKDLVLKKKTELEELRRRTHLVGETNCEAEFAIEAIEAGNINNTINMDMVMLYSLLSCVKILIPVSSSYPFLFLLLHP